LFVLCHRESALPWGPTVRSVIAFSLPLLLAGGISIAFNYARFGSLFEVGATGHHGHPMFDREYLTYGMFSLHYLPRNLYYYFLNPRLGLDPETQALTFDPWGNSMFLVTPALLYALRSWRRRDGFVVALWVGTASCMGLLLVFMSSGWYGFGNRYLLDLMPLAILLVALGMRGRLTRVAILLIALSILVNAWGTYRFCLDNC
jgi:hypothetical protein